MGVRNTATDDWNISVDTHVVFVKDVARKMCVIVRITANSPNLVKMLLRRCLNHHGIPFGFRKIAAVPNDVCCDGAASKYLEGFTTPVQRVRHDFKRAHVDIRAM